MEWLLLAGAVVVLVLYLRLLRDSIRQALPWDAFDVPEEPQRDPRPDELREQLARETPDPITDAGLERILAAVKATELTNERLLADLLGYWEGRHAPIVRDAKPCKRGLACLHEHAAPYVESWLGTPRGRELAMRLAAHEWSRSSDAYMDPQ